MYGVIRDPEGTYIMHYGVKGMHWGIIRSAKELGHDVTKEQVKFDKKEAKRLGRTATIDGYRLKDSNRKIVKLQKKFNKTHKDEDLRNLAAEIAVNAENSERYKKSESALKEAEQRAINTYGASRVKSTKYKTDKKTGVRTVNEPNDRKAHLRTGAAQFLFGLTGSAANVALNSLQTAERAKKGYDYNDPDYAINNADKYNRVSRKDWRNRTQVTRNGNTRVINYR